MNKADIVDVLFDLNRELETNPFLEFVTMMTIANNKIKRERRRAKEANTLSDEQIDKLVSLYDNIKNYLLSNDSILRLMGSTDMEPVYAQCGIKKIDDLDNKVITIKNNKHSTTINEFDNVYYCMEKTFGSLQELVNKSSTKATASLPAPTGLLPTPPAVFVPPVGLPLPTALPLSDAQKKASKITLNLEKLNEKKSKISEIFKIRLKLLEKIEAHEAIKKIDKYLIVQDTAKEFNERNTNMISLSNIYDNIYLIKLEMTKTKDELVTIMNDINKIRSDTAKLLGKIKSLEPTTALTSLSEASGKKIDEFAVKFENIVEAAKKLETDVDAKVNAAQIAAKTAKKIIDNYYKSLGIDSDYENMISGAMTDQELINLLNKNITDLGACKIKLLPELIQGLFYYLRKNCAFKSYGTAGDDTKLIGYEAEGADKDFSLSDLRKYKANMSGVSNKQKILSLYFYILVQISGQIYYNKNRGIVLNSNVLDSMKTYFPTNNMLINDTSIKYPSKIYTEAIKKNSGASFYINISGSGVIGLLGGGANDSDPYYKKYMKYKAKYMKLKVQILG